MSQEALTQQNSALRVCIDRAEGGNARGRVFGQRLAAPLSFVGMGNLLLQLERVMQAQNFPQAFQRIRTFSTPDVGDYQTGLLPEGGMASSQVAAQSGAVLTFQLHVITRQSATWQGNVDWLDGGAPHSFVSDLELLALLDAKLFS